MEKLKNESYKNLLAEIKDIVLKGKNKVYKADTVHPIELVPLSGRRDDK